MGSLSDRTAAIAAASVYLVAMLLSYVFVIAPRYAYLGLDFNPASIGLLALASSLAILPATWAPLDSSRPSTLTYYILYLLLYVPSCVVPVCTLTDRPERYLGYLFCIAACFWGLSWIYRVRLLQIPRIRPSVLVYWTALLGLSLAISFAVVQEFGLQLRMPSLKGEIYELRDDYHSALTGSLLPYFIVAQTKILSPLFVIAGLYYRRPLLLGLGVSSQMLIFLNAGIRTVLFSPLFLVGLYQALKIRQGRRLVIMALALASLIGTCRVADKAFDDEGIYYSSTFVRRMLLTPGILSGYYFEFFSDNEKSLFAHSILEGVVQSRYNDPPPRIIASQYYNANVTNANAGFWADGFANLGYSGVILVTALLGFVLWIFDSIANQTDRRLATLMLAMPSMALVNSAVLTVLLTHGLIFGMILLHLLPAPRPLASRVVRPANPSSTHRSPQLT